MLRHMLEFIQYMQMLNVQNANMHLCKLYKPCRPYKLPKPTIPNQTKYTKPNTPKQTHPTRLTKPNLLNGAHQIRLANPNLLNGAYQMDSTKPKMDFYLLISRICDHWTHDILNIYFRSTIIAMCGVFVLNGRAFV